MFVPYAFLFDPDTAYRSIWHRFCVKKQLPGDGKHHKYPPTEIENSLPQQKKFANFNEFSEIKKIRKNSYKNSLNARVGVAR